MTEIHATGTAETHHLAERATVQAHTSVASRDRSQSIQTASALHNRIVERAQQLRGAGDATWHAASPISTWTRKTYAEGSRTRVILEHVTTSNVSVKLANLDLVSQLVNELTEAGASTNVTWTLTEQSRRTHERAARKAAVASAREIADDYADALGERVVQVASISDVEGRPVAPMGMMRASAEATETAEVTIQEITVRASVTGVFVSE
ncbi:SIMPL domain-containing protein [Gulosibacter molinativorax]|uniref:DUF541 domain-containing protein n=1 Tax=Gulosibacter molinativorax TaxID=256821 RepID=A0ABT7C6D9_9MICO|nr:SIMPL domain-containing protein [Gulosibacter molinativorax]MDJ1370776.1 DUF541 domain-containing protein [Gulosibacter molinativorax]QUY63197.1 Hypotetical protein [Gulosibacter molinativorax]